MTPNPIHKVLLTLSTHELKALLMGGQACILYGAAEFSRDTDITVHASTANIEILREALRSLNARRIAVPPFDISFLQKGHALHFRSYHPDCFRMRIDVISRIRGADPFEQLWQRRATINLPYAGPVQMLSLPDLVRSKKTQRDKDWPMIRRLVEADYENVKNPTVEKIKFWLLESRTPNMLVKLGQEYGDQVRKHISLRPLLEVAAAGDESAVEEGLEKEQRLERDSDRKYWAPLLAELESLRHQGFDTEEEI